MLSNVFNCIRYIRISNNSSAVQLTFFVCFCLLSLNALILCVKLCFPLEAGMSAFIFDMNMLCRNIWFVSYVLVNKGGCFYCQVDFVFNHRPADLFGYDTIFAICLFLSHLIHNSVFIPLDYCLCLLDSIVWFSFSACYLSRFLDFLSVLVIYLEVFF